MCCAWEKISEKKRNSKKLPIRLINIHAEKIKIDCTKAKNVLKFGSPSLSGVLAAAPNVSNIPKNTLNVEG